VVCENQLGPFAKHQTAGVYYSVYVYATEAIGGGSARDQAHVSHDDRYTMIVFRWKRKGKLTVLEQIIPSLTKGNDAANFRSLKESNSLHLDDQNVSGAGLPSRHRTRRRRRDDVGQADGTDLFGAFSSVTLHYDGDS
jgi:hypothetical protein